MIPHRRHTSSAPPSVSLPYGDGLRKCKSVSLPISKQQHLDDDFNLSPVIAYGRSNSISAEDIIKQPMERNQKSDDINRRTIVWMFACAFIMIIATCGRGMIALKDKSEAWTRMKNELEEMRESFDQKKTNYDSFQDLKTQVKRLEEEKGSLEKELEESIAAALVEEESHVMKQELVHSRFEKLHKEIQKISRTEAIEKFGEGPHRVEFVVVLGEPEPEKRVTRRFVVELAPLDLMPHSVNLFLQAVHLNLWDNGMFLHSTKHIISALPSNRNFQPFKDAGFSKVAFQEYTDEYPHLKYTLGFAGRPGGPHFYISTKNNQDLHRPYGQKRHILEEEGDPCFGMVVEGHDVVDRMNELNNMNSKQPSVMMKVKMI